MTGELKKGVKGKQEKGSSSSNSDSDLGYSSKDRESKIGQMQNEFQKIIDGLKQELEVAHKEVAEIN
jgi:gamma-glutamylcysteine synthetase